MVTILKPLKVTIIVIIIGVVSFSIVWFGILPLFFGTTGEDELDEETEKDIEILAQGELVKMDNNHWGSGTVQLIKKVDGNYSIYFVNVTIAPGPELYVYLSEKSNFSGISDTPGNYIDLGKLPAQSGTFEVAIYQDTSNIENYKSVLIWCLPFSVVFSYASLITNQSFLIN